MSKKANPKDYKTSVRFPSDYKSKIGTLVKSFKTNISDVLRMGVDRLWSEYQAGPAKTFTGSPEVQKQKLAIYMAYRDHKGEAMAAREVGTTSVQVRQWRKDDPFFDVMCTEARMESLERVEHRLWTNGVQKGETKACFGILNAKSDDYGLIKRGYADRELMKAMKDRFYPILARRLSRQTLELVLGDIAEEFGGGSTRDTPELTE